MPRDRNTHGRAQAFTILTRVRPGGTIWLRLNFLAGRHVPYLTQALRKLEFIHYARWGIFKPRPDTSSRYLLVTSNFNGTWDDYIEVFSEIVPWRIRAIWITSYGFAGPSPPDRLKRFAHEHQLDADHYYSAYPHATTRLIDSALALRQEWAHFVDGVEPDSTAGEFHAGWTAFLTKVQGSL